VLKQSVTLDSVNCHFGTVMKFSESTVLIVEGWCNYVDVVPMSSQAASQTLGKTRCTIDVRRKSVSANNYR
jgi:hypothetical protein